MISKGKLVEVIQERGTFYDSFTLADHILAALAAEEPAQGDGLMGELDKFRKHCMEFGYGAIEDREFGAILSRHPASIAQITEPALKLWIENELKHIEIKGPFQDGLIYAYQNILEKVDT